MTDVKTIGAEMARQGNRGTQYPMFVIQEDERVFVQPGDDYDERERVEDTDDIYLCEADTERFENGDELIDDCDDCDQEAYDHFRIQSRLAVEMAGVFFTDKACQEHIDENHYHYRNPRVYGVGAWRNEEVQAVQKHLIELAGEKVPSHYD